LLQNESVKELLSFTTDNWKSLSLNCIHPLVSDIETFLGGRAVASDCWVPAESLWNSKVIPFPEENSACLKITAIAR
jgi:hypothetical protein